MNLLFSIKGYFMHPLPERESGWAYGSYVGLHDNYDNAYLRRVTGKQTLTDFWPRQSFLWYDTDYKIKSVKVTDYKSTIGVIPKEGLATTKILRFLLPWCTSLVFIFQCLYKRLSRRKLESEMS